MLIQNYYEQIEYQETRVLSIDQQPLVFLNTAP